MLDWIVTVGPWSLDTRSLTLDELELIQHLCGTPWHGLDPMTRTTDLSAIAAIVVQRHVPLAERAAAMAGVRRADLSVESVT